MPQSCPSATARDRLPVFDRAQRMVAATRAVAAHGFPPGLPLFFLFAGILPSGASSSHALRRWSHIRARSLARGTSHASCLWHLAHARLSHRAVGGAATATLCPTFIAYHLGISCPRHQDTSVPSQCAVDALRPTVTTQSSRRGRRFGARRPCWGVFSCRCVVGLACGR